MKKLALVLLFSPVLAFMCGCGGAPLPISVSLTPSAQTTIDQGQILQFNAIVANDSSGKGVTWGINIACAAGGVPCGGSFTNITPTSATYNAPTLVSSNLTVGVTATSVADPTKSASTPVVVTPPPSITTTSLPHGTVDTAYSATLQASGGAGALTWSVSMGNLPAGLQLNSSTGVISGTPTTSGTSTFTVQVTDSSGGAEGPVSAQKQLSITTILGITTTSLPNGVVGTAYSASVAVAGGTPPLTWSITGSLPNGLSLNSSTGAISGTPTAVGTSNFTVTVTDSSTPKQTKSQALSITIYPVLAITTTSLPNDVVSTAYTTTLAATGGDPPYTWSITAGTLPAGLTLSGSGTISGTPTAAGTATFTVTAMDSATPQQTKTEQLGITIYTELTITSTSMANGVVDTAYTGSVAVAGGTSPYTWSITAGSLPAALSLNSSTGVITGTPAATGTSVFTVTVTDSSAPKQNQSQPLSIAINGPAEACASSGNESALAGQYAFSLSGYNATGFLALVGSFTADGSGHITAGEVDTNGALGVQHDNINTTTSSYSVGSDDRGCATIATSFGTFTTRFALGSFSVERAAGSAGGGAATEGRMIEWEAASESAFIADGHILQQTASSFSGGLSGSYAFQGHGVDSSNLQTGAVGVISASSGSLTNGEVVISKPGVVEMLSAITGAYTNADPNGRFTGSTTPPDEPTTTEVSYLVSSSGALIMTTNPPAEGVLAGESTLQSVPSGGFSNSSLNGSIVYYMTGLNDSGSGGEAGIGLASADGAGSLTVTDYEDNGGTWSGPSTSTCTYSVEPTGLVQISGGSNCPQARVFYLTATNTAYMLGTGSNVQIGQAEPQVVPSGGFTAASIAGTFYAGTLEVYTQDEETEVDVITLNASGGARGTSDITSTTEQAADSPISVTITVNTNGTFTSSQHPTILGGIVISSGELVLVNNQNSTYPTIQMIKQFP